jgi:hypothetical protein
MEIAIIVFFAAIFGGAVFLFLLIRLVFGRQRGAGGGRGSARGLASVGAVDPGSDEDEDEAYFADRSVSYGDSEPEAVQASAQASAVAFEVAGPAEQGGYDQGSGYDSGSACDPGSGSDSGTGSDSGSDSGSGSSD